MVEIVSAPLGRAMKAGVRYTLYHPKWYRPHVSVWWWLQTWSYTKFVLRELTSVPVAYIALNSLWLVRSLAQGPGGYNAFLERMRSPLFLFLNSLSFAAVLFHAITWFNLAPRAMVVRLAGRRLPDAVVVGLNYFAWLVASLVAGWFLLRG